MAAVTAVRSLFLDVGVGEARGVVQLRGRPERLLIERPGEPAVQKLGARVAARVRRIERGLGMAFLDLGEGPDAVVSGQSGVTEGAVLEVEITAEARAGKGPVVRVLGPAEGDAPRMLAPGPTLEERLKLLAPRVSVTRGPDAREAADEAEAEALERDYAMPEGGSLAIERTRGLTAVDVDLGARPGGDAKRVSRTANLAAIVETARLLRLKGLGGLIVMDLAGRGHDGDALGRAAREAFAADGPGVSVGPISRFGTMELLKPWREQPLGERLCDPSGRLSPTTVALRLARALEREGRASGGARLLAQAAPEVAAAFEPLRAGLTERLGGRFTIQEDARAERAHFRVSAQ